jgi:hypothetical protein
MRMLVAVIVVMAAGAVTLHAQEVKAEAKGGEVSFKEDVLPLFRKHCLPCHAEAESNPSGLSLDSRELLMKGGENGAAVVPGKISAGTLMDKLGEKPSFGARMPLNSKRKIREGKAVWFTDAEVKLVATWVAQGAKDN